MNPERTLIVYFTRTGTTEEVAKAIRRELGCAIEPIVDRVERRGVVGYLRSGYQAFFGRPVALEPRVHDPADFDLVCIGTPIWNASVSAPVRAYLEANRSRLPRVAFFVTHGGSSSARVLRQMEEICGQPPVVTLVLRTEEVNRGAIAAKIRTFANALRGEPARVSQRPPVSPSV